MREGLKVPQEQPKRGRLWLNDGSCIRLRPERKDHAWCYDFTVARTAEGRVSRIPTILDDHSSECLAILVYRKMSSQDVMDQLLNLLVFRGIPENIRSNNGSELTARAIRKWLNRLAVKTLFMEPGSAWEKGYMESFNGELRDELLDREIFVTLIERWWREYNQVRPQSALKYRPPAPEAIMLVILT